MAGIFISYRRADSDGWAGRLRDALRARFGNRVFQDVESIADGEIFSEVIDRALQECDVALIIIGPNWATARDANGRRLDQADDWVRTETSLVLDRKIRVIPVLVGGASMPRPEDLPEDLRSLTRRQAREIRSNSWDSDVALLTNHLRQIVGPHKRPAWQYAVATLAVLGAIGVFAGSRFFGQPANTPAPAEQTAASPAGASMQRQEATPPAPAVVPSPKIAASDTPKEKQPESVQPPKVKPQPEPPVVAVTPAPSTATAVPVKPAPAPLRQAEREQPTIARPAPPPVRASAEAPPPEPRKPAAAQAEAPPDRTAAATPAPPAAVPKPPSQPAPAAAPAVVAHAALNLPNRPAAARELKVGDSWTYRLREVRLDRNLATVTHEIGGGDKSGIREMVRLGARKPDADTGGDSPAGTQRRMPLEARIFEQPLGQNATLFEFSPFMTAFSDLQPGITWSKIAGATSPDSINDWRFNGKVTGRERVRVPAGSFDAIKAELEGQVDLTSPLTRDPYGDTTVSYQTYTVWFVPEIGRAIKYERRTFNRVRRLLEHEQYELVSYRLN